MMKALVYRGPSQRAIEWRPKPQIVAPTDVIVRVTKSAIRGTDHPMLGGCMPTWEPGRILGHEGFGIVEMAGPSVQMYCPGDQVLISGITACGRCDCCRRGLFAHCAIGGWILGNTIDGCHAEYVRIPYADTSLYPIPDGFEEDALVAHSDGSPADFECWAPNGTVARGSTVAIVGSGPIGLAALLALQSCSPAAIIMIDLDDSRLAVAKRFGAADCVNSRDGRAVEAVMALTANRGVDTAIEAMDISATFELCESLIAPGGVIASIGVHGTKLALHRERLWDLNNSVATRLVDAVSVPMLLNLFKSHKIDPKLLITHYFPLTHILEAYESVAHAAGTTA